MQKFKSFAFLSLLLLAGCFSVQLAPNYDADLFKQITEANVEVMQLFAATSSGTDQSTFAQREHTYNAIIGKLNALALQSDSRPIPDAELLEKINKRLGESSLPNDPDSIPSAGVLLTVSGQITKMRDTDKSKGLNAETVNLFLNGARLSMQQVITYESFLER